MAPAPRIAMGSVGGASISRCVDFVSRLVANAGGNVSEIGKMGDAAPAGVGAIRRLWGYSGACVECKLLR